MGNCSHNNGDMPIETEDSHSGMREVFQTSSSWNQLYSYTIPVLNVSAKIAKLKMRSMRLYEYVAGFAGGVTGAALLRRPGHTCDKA